MAEILELIRMVESEGGADRHLDRIVCEALDYRPHWWRVPRLTASIDEVMLCAEAVSKPNHIHTYSLELGGDLLPDGNRGWPAASLRWYPPGKAGPEWRAQIGSAQTPARAALAGLLRGVHYERHGFSAAERGREQRYPPGYGSKQAASPEDV